ncbi:diaminopimelate decarboxylase [Corynebacterium sp. TAE3-ERU12]|uniref:diaminopimelate decarboxylase n=1 Tax=Corynebacterium sp. TAE3-ERU12 TaxID=2849491 RepID=UPI001C48A8B0|nr:diaminopimelate decarboxylase [Corynebacterium sp. TAE3-ERU12]MBV7295096.1 diaminopimelate decarboxylase [Corynebacterium sp. TAE3-ERU12]
MTILGNGFDSSERPNVPDSSDFNELPQAVWPITAKRGADDVVEVGGVALTDIAEEFGTPVFVLDEEDFRTRCRAMAKAFRGADNVHYASKAFLCTTVVKWAQEEGLHLDVASGGEMGVALHAGFPASSMTFHGNNKSEQEIADAIAAGVGRIVVDSFIELERVSAAAAAAGVVQDVFIRVTPGVEAHTHEFIATAHEDQKFGFSLAAGDALEATDRAYTDPHLRLTGLHCHIGSQIVDADGFVLAAERILKAVANLVGRHGDAVTQDLTTLDLGGGFGIAYLPGEFPLEIQGLADEILAAVEAEAERLGLPTPTIAIEPGRSLIGPSMVTVYTVGTTKQVQVDERLSRRYLSVDGGMSDNIRPALYSAPYDGRIVNRRVSGDRVPSRVVGKHCESGDILVNDALYPNDIAEGDLLAIGATGAYCYAMSSRYNMLQRPAVVAVRDGQARLILRRESLSDLLSLECENPS